MTSAFFLEYCTLNTLCFYYSLKTEAVIQRENEN